MNITCILKILTTPQQVAELCVSLFGEGTARPDAEQVELFIAHCMTPPQGGYVRVLMSPEYADSLQYLQDTYESTDVEVVSIERDGLQRIFEVAPDEHLGVFAGYPVEAM